MDEYDFDGEYDDEEDWTCQNCRGTGVDPWNDGILPCEECDGEGYYWWL